MSITGEDTRIVFVGDGNDNSPYAISFPLRVDTSVEVIYVTDATGVEVVKTITTDYTIAVSGAFTTAALTLVTTAPATGETMLIRRNEPATRLSNYKLGDGQPAAVSNNDFDVRTMSEQTLQEQLDRALVVAKGHPDANLPLTPINMIGSAGLFVVVNSGETDFELLAGSNLTGSGTLNTIPLWTPDGSTLGDSVMTQSGTLITVAGTLTVNSDAVGTTILGRAKIGSTPTNDDVAAFAHFDHFDGASFALEQSDLGHTRLNAPTSRSVTLSIADVGELTVEGTLVDIPSNEFRVTLGDVNILAGALSVAGTITASSTVLTTAAGLLRHQAIDPAIAGTGITYTSGVLSVTSGLSGSGTENTIPLWGAGGVVLGDSIITDSGSQIIIGGAVAVSGTFLTVAKSSPGGEITLGVTNTADADPGSNALLVTTVAGAGSGNPFVEWQVTGEQSYALGIDNSDFDKLVGSIGSALGTANWLEVTTARGITLDAASGQTVALAVNSVEELQVSGTAVTIPSNNLIITAGQLGVGIANPAGALHLKAVDPLAPIGGTGVSILESSNAQAADVGPFLAFRAKHTDAGASAGLGGVLVAKANSTSGNLESYMSFYTRLSSMSERMRLDANGNLGIGVVPTLPLDVNAKAGITALGGYAIKLTNRLALPTAVGQLVIASTTDADAFILAGISDDRVIGITLEGGVGIGSEAWIVVSGIADVRMDAGGAALGDRIISSTTAGTGLVSNGPASAAHFQEIGHAIEAGGASTLVRCVIHFN